MLADLSHAHSPEEFDRFAREALRRFDEITARAAPVLACRAGCSLCCWLRVDVFAHEVFLIAHHLRTDWPAPELAELLPALRAHSTKVLPLTPFEHATQNVPCPLLREGHCSVYAVRPQACRRHHARDFAACQYTFDHPTDLEFPGTHDRALFNALSDAMGRGIEAYAELGFDHAIYELGTALEEALTDPAAWERWRNRQPAFLRASITPSA